MVEKAYWRSSVCVGGSVVAVCPCSIHQEPETVELESRSSIAFKTYPYPKLPTSTRQAPLSEALRAFKLMDQAENQLIKT